MAAVVDPVLACEFVADVRGEDVDEVVGEVAGVVTGGPSSGLQGAVSREHDQTVYECPADESQRRGTRWFSVGSRQAADRRVQCPNGFSLCLRERRVAGVQLAGPKHEVEDKLVRLRKSLSKQGYDAGAQTIAEHLARQIADVPAVSTIWRILHKRGFVVPQPHKRPRSAWKRFAAEQPNELWQADVTHWHLADDTDVEILNIIDDHSRLALASRARATVTGHDVVVPPAVPPAGFEPAAFCSGGRRSIP